MPRKGKLIVIEGLDGSEKATQAALLEQDLRARGSMVEKVSFPDYDSRSISYVTGWKKQYLAGYTILADRYTTSNAVHQMARLPKTEWDRYGGDDEKKDPHEREADYQQANYQQANRDAARRLGWNRVTCSEGDAPLGVNEIFRAVQALCD